jgi:hypothetical protein
VNLSGFWGNNNVFFDPASPITTFAISNNGEENVATESASLALTSALSTRVVSHLRAQFSRDLQESTANSSDPRTRIYSILDGIGRSSILPRETREHRLHLTDTVSLEIGRHSLKFGGDALLTWTYNFFPSMFGGEYYFDDISVNPWTFEPMRSGMQITPLRAYAHQVPRYYIQNFGNAVSHPDTNEYAAFVQDGLRITHRLAVSLGVRYDLQTFNTRELVTNPLWPQSGHVPVNNLNFAPRVGLAYSIGNNRPLVVRAGWGVFYTRIPQIYLSTITTDNGVNSFNLFLNNTDYYGHQAFPTFPNPLVNCPLKSAFCAPPPSVISQLAADVSAFAPNFQTPRVQQASVNVEREFADRLAAGLSYLYVHGQNMIRARDVNLPLPADATYPVYDETGENFLGSYYTLPSFSTWQLTRSMTCPYPPCINPLDRPIPQLQAINQFESVAWSDYQGATLSVRRRMTHGLYFRLSYTYAHAIDDGQDALVAGRPSTVENTYSTSGERGPSVTDQRNRLAFSWIAEPRLFGRDHDFFSKLFNDWKFSGVLTYGSGRPFDARVFGDPNQDGNTSNDRLPGYGRNAFLGPDYATADVRLARRLFLGARLKMDLIVESFNLFNRDNQRLTITDDGFQSNGAQFTQSDKTIGISSFPAYYQHSVNFLQATSAYAPRQIQLALRLTF